MVAVNIELERNEHKGLGKRLQPQDSLFKWINMVFILSKIIIFLNIFKNDPVPVSIGTSTM